MPAAAQQQKQGVVNKEIWIGILSHEIWKTHSVKSRHDTKGFEAETPPTFPC